MRSRGRGLPSRMTCGRGRARAGPGGGRGRAPGPGRRWAPAAGGPGGSGHAAARRFPVGHFRHLPGVVGRGGLGGRGGLLDGRGACRGTAWVAAGVGRGGAAGGGVRGRRGRAGLGARAASAGDQPGSYADGSAAAAGWGRP